MQKQDASFKNKMKHEIQHKFNEILKFIQSQESIENRVLKLMDDILAEKKHNEENNIEQTINQRLLNAEEGNSRKNILNSLNYIM